MNRAPIRARGLWLTVVVLSLSSCMGTSGMQWTELAPRPADPSQVMNLTGTVHRLEVEGGVYVIRDAQGAQFQPTNLPAAFQVDGMPIMAEGRRRDDMMSTGMVGPLVELIRVRERSGSAPSRTGLQGSSWRLEDLAGAGVVAGSEATLEFSADGQASGNTSCNQFRGPVTIQGESITFGPMITTRRACPEAVMDQEKRFLDELGKAKRFEVKEQSLFIHGDNAQAMRFVRVR